MKPEWIIESVKAGVKLETRPYMLYNVNEYVNLFSPSYPYQLYDVGLIVKGCTLGNIMREFYFTEKPDNIL